MGSADQGQVVSLSGKHLHLQRAISLALTFFFFLNFYIIDKIRDIRNAEHRQSSARCQQLVRRVSGLILSPGCSL